ncbi:hypothetical protein BSF38_00522 [Paludisphaera borealis]|uniref:Uncharacterized protein n=1 Tax=Paludisphaera borealis TaxID=1387353 RepID=A0A1U7CJM5_9BACT|nr:hypothetical protein BSF38_00522 [Paludisphaera borealis]
MFRSFGRDRRRLSLSRESGEFSSRVVPVKPVQSLLVTRSFRSHLVAPKFRAGERNRRSSPSLGRMLKVEDSASRPALSQLGCRARTGSASAHEADGFERRERSQASTEGKSQEVCGKSARTEPIGRGRFEGSRDSEKCAIKANRFAWSGGGFCRKSARTEPIRRRGRRAGLAGGSVEKRANGPNFGGRRSRRVRRTARIVIRPSATFSRGENG